MDKDATAFRIDHVVNVVNEAGGEAFVSRSGSSAIIGISGDLELAGSDSVATLNLAGLPGVADVVRISVPYKLVSREHRRERSVIKIAGVPIGPDTLTVIACPCAVETPSRLSPRRGWPGRRARRCCAAARSSRSIDDWFQRRQQGRRHAAATRPPPWPSSPPAASDRASRPRTGRRSRSACRVRSAPPRS